MGHLNSDDGNEDDLQPLKPMISYDPQGQDVPSNPDEMPMLASKHRQIGNKKASVDLVKQQRLLNENESQNSNSYGQLPLADKSSLLD